MPVMVGTYEVNDQKQAVLKLISWSSIQMQ
jgi:hypothetical protein